MKNRYMVFIFFVAVFGIAVSGFISFLQAAEIIYLEGAVQVQSGSDSAWKTAEKGMKVNIGDSIRTARHSLADIALDDEKKNTIRIDPKTLVVLNSATAGTIDRLDLSHGKVTSKLENLKAGLSFEVNTPSTVAGVRGSSYSVYAERDSDEVRAFKDSVFLKAFDDQKNILSELTIPEGFKAFIERFETPGMLIQMSTREFERFDRLNDEISEHEQGKERTRAEREAQRREAAAKAHEDQKPPLEQHTEQVNAQENIVEQLGEAKERVEEKTVDQTIEERHGDITPPDEEPHEEYYH